MTAITVRPGRLRDAAEEIERSTGLRVQELRDQLIPQLPKDLRAYEVSSICMPDDEDDYATPDLVVLPKDWGRDDEWLADPHDVVFALEVISSAERARDIATKTDWYATAGVAALLAVDPRDGTWTLYTHPRDGAYQGVLHGKYGEPVPLPSPLPAELDTSGLPLYAPRG
ncbi:Uma2 family endonuclease [Kitasatospora sp. NPDC018058]|uniref:Uma2 family endonuclease n=1 Tax=Kitasatospora sp. NPDC018058 TaxID=3364025 RepID=UPI0037C096E2